MSSINKTHALAAVLGAVLGAPLATVAYRAVVAPVSAAASVGLPLQLQWLDEGAGRPYRFAFTVMTTNGANKAPHQVVCEHDGTKPRLDGVLVAPDPNLSALCAALPVFDNTVQTALAAAAQTLVSKPVPAVP